MRFALRSALALCLCFCPDSLGGQSLSPDGANGSLIVPGRSVGRLKLGDPPGRAKELFPFKPNLDQQWQEDDGCGTTFNWLDWKNSKMLGNVFIRYRDDQVFQIDSGTSSFRTGAGITTSSSPAEVRTRYPHLRAYILSEGFSEASGGRPLVYWVDSEDGIAFGFSYSRRTHQNSYLSWIIVFRPHAEVCPEYSPLGPSDKREIPPYTLETRPR